MYASIYVKLTSFIVYTISLMASFAGNMILTPWYVYIGWCSQLRDAIDPKRHYKKSGSKSKALPKYFQASSELLSVPSNFYFCSTSFNLFVVIWIWSGGNNGRFSTGLLLRQTNKSWEEGINCRWVAFRSKLFSLQVR